MEKFPPVIKDLQQFSEKIKEHEMVLFYFSHEECSVCKVLKPKVYKMVQDEFPRLQMYYVNIIDLPEISGQQSIFAVPTIVVHVQGKEFHRESRNISVGKLKNIIDRPYQYLYP
jgi:thioredoxin-like negative regulator of GroEL